MHYRHDNSWPRSSRARLVTLNNANISYFSDGAGAVEPANYTFFLHFCKHPSIATVSRLAWHGGLLQAPGRFCLSSGQSILPLVGLECAAGDLPLGRADGRCFIDHRAPPPSAEPVYFSLRYACVTPTGGNGSCTCARVCTHVKTDLLVWTSLSERRLNSLPTVLGKRGGFWLSLWARQREIYWRFSLLGVGTRKVSLRSTIKCKGWIETWKSKANVGSFLVPSIFYPIHLGSYSEITDSLEREAGNRKKTLYLSFRVSFSENLGKKVLTWQPCDPQPSLSPCNIYCLGSKSEVSLPALLRLCILICPRGPVHCSKRIVQTWAFTGHDLAPTHWVSLWVCHTQRSVLSHWQLLLWLSGGLGKWVLSPHSRGFVPTNWCPNH